MGESAPGDDESVSRLTRALAMLSARSGMEAAHPINVPQHSRVLSLCLNRVLKEPGLTHMAQGYCKGVVEADVLDRITQLGCELYACEIYASGQVDERVTAIYQEYLTYMQYYSDHVSFTHSCP